MLLVICSIGVSVINPSFNASSTKGIQKNITTNLEKGMPPKTQIPTPFLTNPPDTDVSSPQIQATTKPGGWWNSSYNYRINLTITEPGIGDRVNWPVDVYVTFSPAANKHAIVVLDYNNNKVKFQIWNSTANTTHYFSCTITFLVNIPKGTSRKYFIYYDTSEVVTPRFSSAVTYDVQTDTTTGLPIYIFYGKTYREAIIPPRVQNDSEYIWTGRKISTVKHTTSGTEIGNGLIMDLGVVRNPTATNLSGDANTNYRPVDNFIEPETANGPIFIMYKVINAPLYDQGSNLIAKVNTTYKFYSWGWITETKVLWITDDTDQNAEYWISGYVFDQDDGSDVVFDHVVTPDGSQKLGEGLQWSVSGTIPDWGRKDLSDMIRTYTVEVAENVKYKVDLRWDINVDLDVYIFSERGFLIEGPDNLWDKIDAPAPVGTQDYYESETATATVTEKWIIMVLGYCSLDKVDPLVHFNITVLFDSNSSQVDFFEGTLQHYVYQNTTDAYCNYQATGFPNTIDTTIEGNVNYWVGGYAKRYNPSDEMATKIIHMTQGEDYYVRSSWDLEYSNVHLYLMDPNGRWRLSNTTGSMPPKEMVLYPNVTGDWVLVMHYYDGSYYDPDDQSAYDDITYELYVEPPFAETEDYSNSSNSWNWVGFYHESEPRGVGLINISLDYNTDGVLSIDTYWKNKGEGRVADEDYIFWAFRLHNVSAKTGQYIHFISAVYLWDANGSGVNRYRDLAEFGSLIRSNLDVNIGQTERYRLLVEFNIKDSSNENICGANISLLNSTSGEILYTGLTNADGNLTLDVWRTDYILNITITSGGNTYKLTNTVNYTSIAFTIHKTYANYTFTKIVRLVIYAIDDEDRNLQYANIVLRNSTMQVSGKTNLTGYFDEYLPKGLWNLTISYRFPIDNYTLYYYNETTGDWEFAKDVYGNNITITKWAIINVTSNILYKLLDHDATALSPLVIELREGLASYNIFWGESIALKVATTSVNVPVDANVTWGIRFLNNMSYVTGFLPVKANRLEKGLYSINLTSDSLESDTDYVIYINGSATGFQEPVPLKISLRVSKRQTYVSLTSITADIYWNERFYVKLEYRDALSGDLVPGGDAKLQLIGKEIHEFSLNETANGVYELDIPNFVYSTGVYDIRIEISKKNYAKAEYNTILIVNPRPTEIRSISYEEIAWKLSENISIEYLDSRFGSTPITGAEGYFIVENRMTGDQIYQGSLTEVSGNYILTLDILKIGRKSIRISIFIGKQYYTNKTFYIYIDILSRSTYVTSNITYIQEYWGNSVGIQLNYFDIESGQPEPIGGANTSIAVYPFGEEYPIWSYNITHEVESGVYEARINTSILGEGNFIVRVSVIKENYTIGKLEIPLDILKRPAIVSYAPKTISLIWGDVGNITINIIDLVTGTPFDPENHTLTVIGPSEVYGTLSLEKLEIGTFGLTVNSTLIGNITLPIEFTIILQFTRNHYSIDQINMTVRIAPVTIQISLSVKEKTYLNPITGQGKSVVTLTLIDQSNNLPLTGANISILIMLGEKQLKEVLAEETELGVYQAEISWANLDGFEPGQTYTISIKVNSLERNGFSTSSASVFSTVVEGNKSIFVDYYGGSTLIFGKKYPNLIVFPSILALAIFGIFLAVKLYAYYTVPPEVREINRLIKEIKRGTIKPIFVDRDIEIEKIAKKEMIGG